MKFAAFSVIASAALAVAQTTAPAAMTMNTPTGVMECYNTLLTWTGGTPPFQITVLPAGQPNATPLETLATTSDHQLTWQCKEAANTSIFFHLKELTSGTTVDSGAVTVQAGNATLCGTSSGSSSAPAASSDAATTPPVASSAPSTNAPATNAPTTSAAANTGTNKPQSSNNSKTSSSAASSPTTQGSGGAGQLQAPAALAGAAAFAMALFA